VPFNAASDVDKRSSEACTSIAALAALSICHAAFARCTRVAASCRSLTSSCPRVAMSGQRPLMRADAWTEPFKLASMPRGAKSRHSGAS